MRKNLRIIALVIVTTAMASWVLAGANRGWTKTRIMVMKTEEVTGNPYPDYQDRFVPGVDFLGAAGLGAGVLAGISFLFRDKQAGT